jgi:hypothetical protein
MDFLTIFEFVGLVLFGIGFYHVFLWLSDRKALSIMRSKASAKGLEAKHDAADDLFGFIADMKAGFDANKAAGGNIKDFAMKEVPIIVLKHPRTAARFGKRLYDLIGGEGEGLDGLLKNGFGDMLDAPEASKN